MKIKATIQSLWKQTNSSTDKMKSEQSQNNDLNQSH